MPRCGIVGKLWGCFLLLRLLLTPHCAQTAPSRGCDWATMVNWRLLACSILPWNPTLFLSHLVSPLPIHLTPFCSFSSLDECQLLDFVHVTAVYASWKANDMSYISKYMVDYILNLNGKMILAILPRASAFRIKCCLLGTIVKLVWLSIPVFILCTTTPQLYGPWLLCWALSLWKVQDSMPFHVLNHCWHCKTEKATEFSWKTILLDKYQREYKEYNRSIMGIGNSIWDGKRHMAFVLHWPKPNSKVNR